MQSGKLRHRVEVQTNTPVLDTLGQPVASWAVTATVRAAINPLRGNELMIARQVTPQVTHEIILRHRSLTSAQRLVESGGTRTFAILSVVNLNERNHEMRVMCIEEPS